MDRLIGKIHVWQTLCDNEFEIEDAESFGSACADAWRELQRLKLDQETSIGALMDHINNNVLDY